MQINTLRNENKRLLARLRSTTTSPQLSRMNKKGSRTVHSAHARKQKGNKCKLKHDILLESISREPEKQKYCR